MFFAMRFGSFVAGMVFSLARPREHRQFQQRTRSRRWPRSGHGSDERPQHLPTSLAVLPGNLTADHVR